MGLLFFRWTKSALLTAARHHSPRIKHGPHPKHTVARITSGPAAAAAAAAAGQPAGVARRGQLPLDRRVLDNQPERA